MKTTLSQRKWLWSRMDKVDLRKNLSNSLITNDYHSKLLEISVVFGADSLSFFYGALFLLAVWYPLVAIGIWGFTKIVLSILQSFFRKRFLEQLEEEVIENNLYPNFFSTHKDNISDE